MKKTNTLNPNKENQEAPELSDFLGFLRRLQSDGVISPEQYLAIENSNSDNVLSSYLILALEIEAGFWGTMIPTILYTSRDDFSQSPSSLMIEYVLLSIGATTLRGSLAYWRGRSHGLSQPSTFAILEIIPKVGRLAPILWLPEHRDYLVMQLIYKKYKNKEYSPDGVVSDIEKYRNKINKLQKIKMTLDTTLDRVRNIF